MAEVEFQQRVEAVRRFNRLFTKQIGLLHEGLLGSAFSLTQARVIYEVALHGETTATELRKELDLDGSYLSRILRRFEASGLISKQQSASDGRRSLLSLTDRGNEAFAMLNSRARNEIAAILEKLSKEDQIRLVNAMKTIEELLGSEVRDQAPYLLRPHEPGDMGWVVHRHGVLYAQEYGWDEQFEALVAGIVSAFLTKHDPRRERCWIAELGGEVVGSVFLVRKSKTVAKLRLLLVEPKVRGRGIGTRLVEECTRFARRAGYRRITLWTNSVLKSARRVYEKTGFCLVREEPHHSFGHDLVGETWELELSGQADPRLGARRAAR